VGHAARLTGCAAGEGGQDRGDGRVVAQAPGVQD
jgi:hypothetical protein